MYMYICINCTFMYTIIILCIVLSYVTLVLGCHINYHPTTISNYITHTDILLQCNRNNGTNSDDVLSN